MKTVFISIKFMIVMTLITGVFYPVAMFAFGHAVFPEKAGGSFLKGADDRILGSKLIAQRFKDPKYFFVRPSAVDYNPQVSGASNYGLTSSAFFEGVQLRRKSGAEGDLLFASGSGLDPHISPQSGESQIGRVAAARGMSESELRSIVRKYTEQRQFRILGEERINVLRLNLALDERR